MGIVPIGGTLRVWKVMEYSSSYEGITTYKGRIRFSNIFEKRVGLVFKVIIGMLSKVWEKGMINHS